MSEDILYEKIDEITTRLDQIVTFLKIAFSEKLSEIKEQVFADLVNKRILELADGTRSAHTLKTQVAIDTDVSAKTVERRIIELVSKGLITLKRAGTEKVYVATNLF